MLKVLIADDEPMIVMMIRKMIDWEAKGLKLAGTAGNGLELLEKIRETDPDIVITDIRMPGLDGLALIEKALQEDEGLEFVIISGYKNFEYAHQALTLGVRHYLLKPIDRTELSDTLDRIIAGKVSREASREREEEYARQEEARKQQARRRFLNSILEETGIGTGHKEEAGEEPDFREGRYLAFLVKADWTEEGDIAPGILDILSAVIEREEKAWGCEYVNSPVRSGIIAVINYPPGAREAHPEDMETLFTKCRQELDKFAGYSVTIGVGTEKGGIGGSRETIEEAVLAIKHRLRKGLGRVIYYEKLAPQKLDLKNILAPYGPGIAKAVRALDLTAVKGDFQLLSEEIRMTPGCTPPDLFEMADWFTDVILKTWREEEAEEAVIQEFAGYIGDVADRSTTESLLVQNFEDGIDLFFRRLLNIRRQNGQAPVREAKAYIAGHFRENLSLEDVAEKAGMSPAYFSTFFKKEVGIGFSEYVTQLRCEEAKRLMRETDDPMTLIAEEVGYLDAKYFSRIFRKTVGIKPSEYRKLYR